MKPTRYLPKIETFDGSKFWKNAYAHQRAKLLRLAGAPEDRIPDLASMRYGQLPADLRYEIETGGISKDDLD